MRDGKFSLLAHAALLRVTAGLLCAATTCLVWSFWQGALLEPWELWASTIYLGIGLISVGLGQLAGLIVLLKQLLHRKVLSVFSSTLAAAVTTFVFAAPMTLGASILQPHLLAFILAVVSGLCACILTAMGIGKKHPSLRLPGEDREKTS